MIGQRSAQLVKVVSRNNIVRRMSGHDDHHGPHRVLHENAFAFTIHSYLIVYCVQLFTRPFNKVFVGSALVGMWTVGTGIIGFAVFWNW